MHAGYFKANNNKGKSIFSFYFSQKDGSGFPKTPQISGCTPKFYVIAHIFFMLGVSAPPEFNCFGNTVRWHILTDNWLTFSSVHVRKCWKTSEWERTGCRHILSTHNCNSFIRWSINSSSYRPEGTDKTVKIHVFIKLNVIHITFSNRNIPQPVPSCFG